MELLHQPEFERIKDYWRAFWQHEIIDRPCVCVTAPRRGGRNAPGVPYLAGSDGKYEQALQAYDAWAGETYFGGEAVPFFDVSFGPDQFSAFLGAEIVRSSDSSTTWVKPFVTDWEKAELSLCREPGGAFARMLEFLQAAARCGAGKFLVSMLDLHSGMDCLSAIRRPENLCMDLIDCGDAVEEAMKKVRVLYRPIYDAIYSAAKMDERGCVGWAPTFCEGRFAVVQCDFLCMIGRNHARRFVFPALEEELSALDHAVYHYDGKEALIHLDDILAMPGIDVIQWVPGAGQPRTLEWMELLHRIQKAGKGLWIYDWTAEEIKRHFKELKPEGLVFQVSTRTQEEAVELLDYMKANT